MTQYFAAVDFGHTARAAESPGGAAQGAEASLSFNGIQFGTDPSGGSGVVLRLPQLWGVELTSAELWFPTPTGVVRARTKEGTETWVFDQAAANVQADNTPGEPTLINRVRVAAQNVLVPYPAIRFSGPALAVFAVGNPPTIGNGRVTYRRLWGRALSGSVQGGLILDTALGESPTNPTTFLRRLETSLLDAHAGLSVTSGSTTDLIVQAGANFMANDPLGVLYCAPGDIGPGQGQISTTLAANSAFAYAHFPSVFLRAATAVNMTRLLEVRAGAITTAYNQIAVLQVNRPPTFSRWQIQFNGAFQDVIVAHPMGSDLRTANAIFTAVWRGFLFGGALGQGPLVYQDRLNGGTREFDVVGTLNNGTLVTALRFVEPLDADAVTPISSIFNQT